LGPHKKLSLSKQVLFYIRDPAVALWRKAAGLAAAVYVISPVDFVPDILPLLGWLDDLGVVSAVAAFMIRDIRRHTRQLPQGQPQPEKDVTPPGAGAQRK